MSGKIGEGGPGSAGFNSRPVQTWLDEERAAGRLASGALAVEIAGESALSVCFGQPMPDKSSDDVGPDTQFWLASMTKPIVSVAAMRLIEAKQLDLGQEVGHFVPGFGSQGVLTQSGAVTPLDRPVTVLDLMTHTAGLTYGAFGDQPIHRLYQGRDVYDFRADNRIITERLTSLPLLHQPGTVFEYGMSTDVLGRVIEVVTDQSLDLALDDLVTGPLGMTRTGFRPIPGMSAEFPPSATFDALAPSLRADQSWFSGGAGLFSTLADYLRFARMLLNEGTAEDGIILSRETFALMCQNHLPKDVRYGAYTSALGITAPCPDNGLGFGLGLAVRTKRSRAIPGGIGEVFWPGVSGANFWVDPENEVVVVFLTHAPEDRARHRIGLRKAVYDGMGMGRR